MALRAWYKLDGDANDFIGNNHGAPTGVSWVTGMAGKAAAFDGTIGSYIVLPPETFNGLGDFSIAAWMNVSANKEWHPVISLARTSGPFNELIFGLGADRVCYLFKDDVNIAYGPTVPLNSDLHVIITRKNDIISIYASGIQIGEMTSSSAPLVVGGAVVGQEQDSLLGGYVSGQAYQGRLSDLRIYDHALSAKEAKALSLCLVTHLKMDTDFIDYGRFTPVVINDAVIGTTASIGKGCFENAARATRSLSLPDAPHVTGNQTLSMWLHPTSNAERHNPWNRAYGGEGTITQEIDGTLKYYYGTNGNDGSPYAQFTMTTPLPLGEDSMVTVVRDLSNTMTLKWYLNGALVNTQVATYGFAAESGAPVLIGAGYTENYSGRIDDIRQYATALSDDDVMMLYRQRASLDDRGNLLTHYFVEDAATNFSVKTDVTAASQFSEVGPIDGIIGWWSLEEHLEDISGNDFDATSTNSTPVVIANRRGYGFNGSDSKIDLPSLELPASWSIVTWFNPTDFVKIANLLTATNSNDFDFRIDATTGIPSFFTTSTGNKVALTALYPAEWTQVGLTYDGATLKFYNNDFKDVEYAVVGLTVPNTAFKIGNSGTEWANGYQTGLRIYDRALQSEEIAILYDLGLPTGSKMKLSRDILYLKGQMKELVL